jgi:RimJ/RimL family protein N-acetyltransferase
MEPLLPAHAGALFAPLRDARLYTYVPEDPPLSLAALTARYAQLAAGCPHAGEVWRNWVMLTADNRPVGTLQASVLADHRALVAYLVLAEHWGQGFGSEGVAWMLDEIAARDGVELAEAFIDTRNHASLRLVERLGFSRRATIANADFFKGHTSDEHVYEKRLIRGQNGQ